MLKGQTKNMPIKDRFFSKVQKTNTCWLWKGSLNNWGYGFFHIRRKKFLAHRIAFKINGGILKPKLTIDHLCKVKHCVRPAHLEQVTLSENLHRCECSFVKNSKKTHCKHGHPFNKKNTYKINGHRQCRICNAINVRKYQNRKKS